MRATELTRDDSDTRHGQVHWQAWAEPGKHWQTGLVALHPLPHSGMFFETIAPQLAVNRSVLAPDYPGYGRSQALAAAPTIAIYAEAVMEVLQQAPLRAPFDLFGFHTGCLVAVEMALTWGADIGRLVLVDVPYFDARKRAELMAGEMAQDGFRAAFSYPNEERFAGLSNDCLVIATQSSLLEPSRAAAAAISRCELIELSDVTAPALVNGAAPVARASLRFLDGDVPAPTR